MTLRTKTIASASATLALGLALAVTAQPALARWTFHDDRLGESITAPAGGTRAQTCAGRLKAVAGYGHYIDVAGGDDPAAYVIPADALTAVDYGVWKAPPGFDNFNSAIPIDGGIYFYEPDGTTRHQAKLVGHVTTRPRAALRTPVPAGGNPNVSDNFVFTSAPISVRLSGVKPGNKLGLKPASQEVGGFVDVTAMDCALPVLTAKVDVLPGSRANTVHPENLEELVPVRIFGSKRLRVKKITEVHLGEAKPATVPAKLQPSLRPKDVNHDGRPDRLYYFRQGDTYIQCIDTHVKVTGRTSDRRRFQANPPITTAGCQT